MIDFWLSKEEYLTFKAAFKRLANTRKLTAVDIVFRQILLNQHSNRNQYSNAGFWPITNTKKLRYGMRKDGGYYRALVALFEISENNLLLKQLVKRFDNFIIDEQQRFDVEYSTIIQLRKEIKKEITAYFKHRIANNHPNWCDTNLELPASLRSLIWSRV